ncbi:MAG: spermine/spermidine synthase family protein [Ramlibacter sp.]|nr:spermine/spermidine synthase family protein [Ramlibacter sp.]
MLDPTGPWQHPLPYLSVTLATRSLHFSPGDIQSRMLLQEPDVLELEYTRLMMGFLLFKPRPQTLAMIGLGGGSIAKFCVRQLPESTFRAIENNPFILDLRQHFNVPPDGPRFSVILDDGAQFVRRPPKQFDILLVDGYVDGRIPVQLGSQRFYDDCHETLMPGGIMVANLNAGDCCVDPYLERIVKSFQGNAFAVSVQEDTSRIVFARKGVPFNIVNCRPAAALVDLGVTARAEMEHAFELVAQASRVRSRTDTATQASLVDVPATWSARSAARMDPIEALRHE